MLVTLGDDDRAEGPRSDEEAWLDAPADCRLGPMDEGTRSCLSAQPPDLATVTAAQPKVACVRPSIVPFLYSKRTAVTRSLVSRDGRLNVLWPFLAH